MLFNNRIVRKFTLKNYETDFRQQIKPSAILGFFQEIAVEHSEEMGLGFDTLAQEGYFWVLSKMYVEINDFPKFGEEITVATWPHEPNRAIYERSFEIRSADDKNLINAYSRWCILKTDSKRIVPCSQIKQPQTEYISKKSVGFNDWHVSEIVDKITPSFSIKVANSEYDLNYHVNNIKYADYIFNCFSVAELSAQRLKSFQIHYLKQSHEGDLLEFCRELQPNGEYVIVGVKNGRETAVAARVCFA